MNMTIISGRLVRDPQVSKTNEGETKVSFTVAVDRNYKPKNAQYPESDFYYCIAYKGTADFIAKYFQKGRPIELVLQYRQYKQEDNKTSHFFLVDRANFVVKDSTPSNDAGQMNDLVPENYEPNITDDDIPF